MIALAQIGLVNWFIAIRLLRILTVNRLGLFGINTLYSGNGNRGNCLILYRFRFYLHEAIWHLSLLHLRWGQGGTIGIFSAHCYAAINR